MTNLDPCTKSHATAMEKVRTTEIKLNSTKQELDIKQSTQGGGYKHDQLVIYSTERQNTKKRRKLQRQVTPLKISPIAKQLFEII